MTAASSDSVPTRPASSDSAPTRRDDYLAGLDLDQLRPAAIEAFFVSLPGRAGELLASVAVAEEQMVTEHPQARQAADASLVQVRDELSSTDELLADAGLPTRSRPGDREEASFDHPELATIGETAERVLGRLSTASSSDWTSGEPPLLDRVRVWVGELGWLLHMAAERVDGAIADGSHDVS